MPVTHLRHPLDGRALSFEEAPAVLEKDGLYPRAATLFIIKELGDSQTHVRPSDLQPNMVCRRQKTYMAHPEHKWGVNPDDEWAKHEGTFIHQGLTTEEIQVPGNDLRAEVCGVEMRGKIDNLNDAVEDIKTKSPFNIVRYGPKGSGIKPWVEAWEPKDPNDTIKDWVFQVSAYGVLLAKGGQANPGRGRVWQLYRGVKPSKQRQWKKFEFPLLTEEQLEQQVGPWMRSLSAGLSAAQTNADAWKTLPADGREMVKNDGTMWKCQSCCLKGPCDAESGWSSF